MKIGPLKQKEKAIEKKAKGPKVTKSLKIEPKAKKPAKKVTFKKPKCETKDSGEWNQMKTEINSIENSSKKLPKTNHQTPIENNTG